MMNDQQSPSVFLRNLRIIHISMLSGIIFFAIVAYFIRNKAGSMIGLPELEILTYVSLIFILVEIPLAYWLHTRKMKIVANNPDLNSKLEAYRASHIVKIAMFEGVGFFSCVVLLLGGKNMILVQIVIILIIMMLENPSATKIGHELNLSPGEKDLLDH
jgi:hypothetical protein